MNINNMVHEYHICTKCSYIVPEWLIEAKAYLIVEKLLYKLLIHIRKEYNVMKIKEKVKEYFLDAR